jgi:ABC-type antimicrobial peptide transport system permease subunit
MRAILNTIFLPKIGIGKFILSALAFLIGLTLVLLSLQAYFRIREHITPKKTTSNYVILNKEVGIGNTIFGARAQFTAEELDDLKKQPFIADFGAFNSNKFEATAHLGGNLGISTELFFESVPSQFIDSKPASFKWDEGDDFLPIIISQDFLNLYNFGYALGKGTPQLSKSTIELVPLVVGIYGTERREVFKAKVVGFSERISSILVPDNFLQWANREFANSSGGNASRVIVRLRDDQATVFEKYLDEHGLKISDEKLKYSKILSTMNVVMSVLVFIGTAFMIFSLVIGMLNFSLMVAQAKEEVSLLLQLGYKARHLSTHLLYYLGIFLIAVVVLSVMSFLLGNSFLAKFLSDNGIEISATVSAEVVIAGVVFVLLSILVSAFSINRLIRKQL